MVSVNIPRLVSRRIGGRTYWTWQPTRAVKALGFQQEWFTDRDRAIIRSVELNAQVEAERAKRDQPEPS